jgi:hypothetical protein
MSRKQSLAAAEPSTVEESVAAYLRQHPEFLYEHPELLADLSIPHVTGAGAISLIERQIQALREQISKLKATLHELVAVARDNEQLSRRMHQLTLALMETRGPPELFATLAEGLQRDFGAEFVGVRLFADRLSGDGPTLAEFAGVNPPERELFRSVIAHGKPVCGRLTRQQQAFLFGTSFERDCSAIQVPLQGIDWSGVLAVLSQDPDRYHPGLGVDLLAHLGEVTARVLGPWIAASVAGPTKAA